MLRLVAGASAAVHGTPSCSSPSLSNHAHVPLHPPVPRGSERYWRLLSLAHAHGLRGSFRSVKRSLQHLGSIVHNEYTSAGQVYNDESWFEVRAKALQDRKSCTHLYLGR